MCGIVGTFPHINKVVVDKGIKLLKHRGLDEDAVVETPGGTFGHTHLSIIDAEQKLICVPKKKCTISRFFRNGLVTR